MTAITTTTTEPTAALATRGEKQATILDLITGGASDGEIVRATHVTLGEVRELRASLVPAGPRMPIGVQRRADRTLCECGGFQSEHAGGSGLSPRTFCRAFIEAE